MLEKGFGTEARTLRAGRERAGAETADGGSGTGDAGQQAASSRESAGAGDYSDAPRDPQGSSFKALSRESQTPCSPKDQNAN